MSRVMGIGSVVGVAVVTLALVATSLGQPPERPGPPRDFPGGPPGGPRDFPGGPGGPPGGPRDFPGGPGGPGDFRPPPDPLREALDTNHDQELDAEEIKNAAQSLLKLDADRDGRLNHEEMRPPHPPEMRGPGGPGGPPRDGGRGGPPGDGPRDGRGGPPGDGPREGRGGPPGDGPRDGRGGPPGDGPRDGRGGPGGFGGGPPSPERFLERAMTFDADRDGKLDRNELLKFAEEMGRMRGGMGGGPGGPGGGEGGFRGRGGPPGAGDGGDRPQRPRRPE